MLVCTICYMAANNAGFIADRPLPAWLFDMVLVLASIKAAAEGCCGNRIDDSERGGVLTDEGSSSKPASWLVTASKRLNAKRKEALSIAQSLGQVAISSDRDLARRSLLELVDAWAATGLVACLIIWSMQRSAESFIRWRWECSVLIKSSNSKALIMTAGFRDMVLSSTGT